MSNEFTYKDFTTTSTWKVLDKAIQDLVDNLDIEEKTDRRYIVGYLCKTLVASGIIAE